MRGSSNSAACLMMAAMSAMLVLSTAPSTADVAGAVPVYALPAEPVDPEPEDGAYNVLVDAFLAWDTASKAKAVQCLVFVGHSDNGPEGEYVNTLRAIAEHFGDFNVATTVTEDARALAAALVGKEVLLILEQEDWSLAGMQAFGATMASTLQGFVQDDGRIIACDYAPSGGTAVLLQEAGLMTPVYETTVCEQEAIVVDTHPITEGVAATFTAKSGSVAYSSVGGAEILVADQIGGRPMVAVQEMGAGSVVLMGWDYATYNADMARIIANAVAGAPSPCPTTYAVHFGTDPLELAPLYTDLPGRVYGPVFLEGDTTYYWQVVATNCSGETPGAVWSFTTERCPEPLEPTNPDPADGAVEVPLDTRLTWERGGAERCVVVPNANEAVEGDSANAWPFSVGIRWPSQRYQQIYDAQEIGRAGAITQIRFRVDTETGFAFPPTEMDVDIYLGYAARKVLEAAPVFADNVGMSYTPVFSGTLALTSAAPGESPHDFDIVVDVDDAFEYDPAGGPLLLDIFMYSGPITTTFDCVGAQTAQTATTRIYGKDSVEATSGTVNANGAGTNPFGLVTMFCFDGATPPIAPSSGPVAPALRAGRGKYPVTYDVYLGEDPAGLTLIGEALSDTTCNPGLLEPETAYSWRVVARSRCGYAAGPVWSFTTGPSREFYIISPLNGSTLYAMADAASVLLSLTATAPDTTTSIEYAVDGERAGVADTPPYAVTVALDVAALGLGLHHVEAEAVLATGPTLTAATQFTLAEILPADDSDTNGIPDGPFAALPNEGDTWLRTVDIIETGGTRTVGLIRFEGVAAEAIGDVPIWLVIEPPEDPARNVTVTVPRDVLAQGETAILIVELANDIETLYGPDEAALILPAPEGRVLIDGGQYVEVSILVSTDGIGFTEIDNARLEARPLHLNMQGLAYAPDGTQAFYSHPTALSDQAGTGVRVVAEPGDWTTAHVLDLELGPASLGGNLTSLSVTAPYEGQEGVYHSADTNQNGRIEITEVSRVVTFYNAGSCHSDSTTPDGYGPFEGPQSGPPHDSDFGPQDWRIALRELSRLVTFYNAVRYTVSPFTQDGFAPVVGR